MKRDEAENHSHVIRKIPPNNKSTAAIQEFPLFKVFFVQMKVRHKKREIAGRKEKRKILLYPRKIALLNAFQYFQIAL